jgi:hypothetical protein
MGTAFAGAQPLFPMKVAIGLMLLKLPLAWLIVWPLGMGYPGLLLSHAVLVTAETIILWVGLSPPRDVHRAFVDPIER